MQILDENGLFQPDSLAAAAFIWWKNCKLIYAMQLLSIASCCDCLSRLKAIEKLSNLKSLSCKYRY